MSVKRQRAVLTALIERVDAGIDRIDIRICPSRLGALFDVAAPLPNASDVCRAEGATGGIRRTSAYR